MAGLLQQLLGLLARLGDVLAEARQLDELRLRGCQRIAGAQHAANRAQRGDLSKALAAAPTIDRHQQRAPDAHVVERLLFDVEANQKIERPA